MEEMRHKIGKPLKDRTFPVLQMTCSAMARDQDAESDAAATQRNEKAEFLVVSVTVADFDRAPGAELSKAKGTVLAAYASVERIRRLPDTGDIEWLMATASDARGVLPQWVQHMAVPGQIAKDVPLFLSWIARERKGEVAHPLHAEQQLESDRENGTGPQAAGAEEPRLGQANGQIEGTAAAPSPAAVNGTTDDSQLEIPPPHQGPVPATAEEAAPPPAPAKDDAPKSPTTNEKQEILTSHVPAPVTAAVTTD